MACPLYLTAVILIIAGQTEAVSIGFSAINNNGKLHTQGQNVIFEKVVTNVGGGYDPVTGIFTCPIQGLYVFNVGVLSTPRSLVAINLFHSGKFLITIHAYDDRNHASGSRTVVVDCQRGETVYAVAASSAYLYAGTANSYEHNIFNGFLVGSTAENSISPQSEFVQPQREFGQHQRESGQPQREFVQPQRDFGQPQRDFGQRQREFGQSRREFSN